MDMTDDYSGFNNEHNPEGRSKFRKPLLSEADEHAPAPYGVRRAAGFVLREDAREWYIRKFILPNIPGECDSAYSSIIRLVEGFRGYDDKVLSILDRAAGSKRFGETLEALGKFHEENIGIYDPGVFPGTRHSAGVREFLDKCYQGLKGASS